MKKVALLSIVAAALLFVGCEKKEQQTQKVEQKSVEQKSVQSSAKPAKAEVKKETKKIEEPLPGVPMPKSAEAKNTNKPVAQQVEQKVEEVKKEAVKQVNEAAKEVKKAAKEATEQVKKTVAAILPGAGAAAAGANSAKGKELFGKCASCHGSDGKRKALGKSAPIAGMPKDEVVKILKGYKAGTLNKYGMGALMKSQAAPLSDSDIEALAAYISSLK